MAILRIFCVDGAPSGSYRRHMNICFNIGTWLETLLRFRQVGSDEAGNRYYQERHASKGVLPRRWVIFKGRPEASAVPPEWHAWLHHTTEAPLPTTGRMPWQKPHLPNLTGTVAGYRPPGSQYRGGHRPHATGDYEAWTPGV